MSEEQVLEVPEVPVEAIVEPEKIYEYQPTDESGRALGGKQVIKYKTEQELVEKITDQNVHLVRALREQTRKQRLGIEDVDIIPDEAPRYENPLEFHPRQLSDDEKLQLSRDILDPEKFESATTTIFEASLGAKPAEIGKAISDMSQREMALMAKVESDAFMSANPEYYACRENFKAITGWMVKNKLAPVRQNFQLAYETLKKLPEGPSGVPVILGRPVEVAPAPVPVTEPVVEPIAEIVPEPEVRTKKNVPPPSGLRDGGTTYIPPKKEKYTLTDIERMSSEEYKKKILFEKGFPETVERLENERKRN